MHQARFRGSRRSHRAPTAHRPAPSLSYVTIYATPPGSHRCRSRSTGLPSIRPLSDPMECHHPHHVVASRCSSLRARRSVGWRVRHSERRPLSGYNAASMLVRFSAMQPVASSRLRRLNSSELRAYRSYPDSPLLPAFCGTRILTYGHP